MSSPILVTKLYIPPHHPKVVARPRLIERLNEGLHRKLTLISAPAGFGKTTLVSEWIARYGGQVAWLSLDEGDSDPTRFLTYFIAALRTVAPNIGEGVLDSLQSSQPPLTETILTALLNEISAVPTDFVLVLDDYHIVDARAVDHALTLLVEHLPTQMHLVITTREDPALPISRLRARAQLTELRAADLRFTPSEAAEFLNQIVGLNLSAEDVAILETRTEGWIAGLQLAALSMQGHQDVTGFIQEFAGDHRHIVDYLVEEVLQRQPETVRNFLLQTSILDRLNGSLCDAVTGQPGGKERLEALQRGNFFLIPLDDKRHWYRYHHLFADVLRMHLIAEQPDQVPALHRRASEWYEQNGSAADAIRHALAGEDFERAADLIEIATPAMARSRQVATLLGWLRSLPDDLVRARPVINVAYAHLLVDSGQVDGVEDRLRDAERWLDMMAETSERPEAIPDEMVIVDQEAFRRLPGAIAIARAGLSLARGDVPGAMTHARRALDVAPEDDHLTRGGAAGFLGLAFWTSGDLEAAHRMFADGMASLQKAGNISDTIYGATTLAAIRIAQGRLREAMRTYERGLQLATEYGTPALPVRGTADMHVGMSELYREHNDLEAATQHLLRSQELGEHSGFPQNRYRWHVAMARIREVQGDLHGALDLLDEAERLYMSDFSPNVRPITALKARIWIAQGRLGEALDWAREQGFSAEDEVSYLREFEHITLARILLAQSQSDWTDSSIHTAIGLLERLLKAAEEGGRTGNAIEILVLQALLAHQALGDIPSALAPLERALTLAEPERYVRIFLDEGTDMAQLLREAALRGIMPSYTGKLLAAFESEQQLDIGEVSLPPSPASSPLMEPLSQRELEILRLFKTELSGPEIARELVVALSTVRTHTKSIYSKLNVNNRRAAVKRAIELGLI
ncbi:MAG TPA: LuxR C-terminal-related transcriptional regulator [Anaerolineales bacterium]|nr:LuxR C-terminal-related transcriptional regulator [Anaerolineales bacterium]